MADGGGPSAPQLAAAPKGDDPNGDLPFLVLSKAFQACEDLMFASPRPSRLKDRHINLLKGLLAHVRRRPQDDTFQVMRLLCPKVRRFAMRGRSIVLACWEELGWARSATRPPACLPAWRLAQRDMSLRGSYQLKEVSLSHVLIRACGATKVRAPLVQGPGAAGGPAMVLACSDLLAQGGAHQGLIREDTGAGRPARRRAGQTWACALACTWRRQAARAACAAMRACAGRRRGKGHCALPARRDGQHARALPPGLLPGEQARRQGGWGTRQCSCGAPGLACHPQG